MRRAGEHVRLAAVVAGGDDDDDAGPPRPLECEGERIGVVRQGRAAGIGEVEHLDVELVGVIDGPVDAGDHL